MLDGTVVTTCKDSLHCTIRVVSEMLATIVSKRCTVKVGLYNNFVVSETSVFLKLGLQLDVTVVTK